ncbi:MAG TPA: cytidylate kinase-like family protein, partial [Dehalococcoidia bacterium]|nr:cytidylate kinase-like family protein [Dehalococcoidia bacterium]
ATFQNSGMTLSIGLFFSLMIAGLSSTLPPTMYAGLVAHGVAPATATGISHLPPVASLFAAFLGYNPMSTLLGPALQSVPHAQLAYITGRTFFPTLISAPFITGMHLTFGFALVMMLIAAAASYLRGGLRRAETLQRAVATSTDTAPATHVAAPQFAGAAVPSGSLSSRRKPVVTISASFGALGSQIAPRVADELGVPFLDRAINTVTAQRLEVPLSTVLDLEAAPQPALARAIAAVVDTPQFGATPPVPADGRPPEDVLLEETATAMRMAAEHTGGVLLGRGGMAVLRDVPGVLHVRLDGPPERRVRQVMQYGFSEADAWRQLQQTDRAREAYLRAMLGVDAHDETLYELVIDTTEHSADESVAMIVRAARQSVAAAADGEARWRAAGESGGPPA